MKDTATRMEQTEKRSKVAFLSYGGYWLRARSFNGNVLPLVCSYADFRCSRIPVRHRLNEKNTGCSHMKLEMERILVFVNSSCILFRPVLNTFNGCWKLSHKRTITWENNAPWITLFCDWPKFQNYGSCKL